jgi:drug/metabolite transporter (DMT)-like permease
VFSISPSTSLAPQPELPALLGLLAAITWGAADFAGGLATRRAAPSRVVLIAHGVSLLLLAAVSLPGTVHLPAWALAVALLSGIVGGIALMVFYEALALGAMGLSAALAGLLTAVLPVLLAAHTEGLPAPPQLAGFLLAAVAILLIAYAPATPHSSNHRTSGKALGFATLAGLGFGLQLIWLHSAAAAGQPHSGSSFSTVLRSLMLSRLGGATVALTAMAAARLRHRSRLLLPPATEASATYRLPLFAVAVAAGLLDTLGNGLYMLSSLGGRLDVAAVLSSLYPGGTILLAAIFLRERATRMQALGMGVALAAVALIAW